MDRYSPFSAFLTFLTDLFPLYSPKLPCQYTHIGGETFELSNEKISRQNDGIGSFSVIASKAPLPIYTYWLRTPERSNEKISRQNLVSDLFPL